MGKFTLTFFVVAMGCVVALAVSSVAAVLKDVSVASWSFFAGLFLFIVAIVAIILAIVTDEAAQL